MINSLSLAELKKTEMGKELPKVTSQRVVKQVFSNFVHLYKDKPFLNSNIGNQVLRMIDHSNIRVTILGSEEECIKFIPSNSLICLKIFLIIF